MRINIPECFCGTYINISPMGIYLQLFFTEKVKNYGDKEMKINQEPTTVYETIVKFEHVRIWNTGEYLIFWKKQNTVGPRYQLTPHT